MQIACCKQYSRQKTYKCRVFFISFVNLKIGVLDKTSCGMSQGELNWTSHVRQFSLALCCRETVYVSCSALGLLIGITKSIWHVSKTCFSNAKLFEQGFSLEAKSGGWINLGKVDCLNKSKR